MSEKSLSHSFFLSFFPCIVFFLKNNSDFRLAHFLSFLLFFVPPKKEPLKLLILTAGHAGTCAMGLGGPVFEGPAKFFFLYLVLLKAIFYLGPY